ncbi:NtaA/DmoA family FMN-dependent monooxygenase [Cryobacterium arcticum]|nr:NtaA/DmoA family FMN-dependent monooxygenase [Cryobacterium arcticum]
MGWFVGQGFSANGWTDFWAGNRVNTWMKPDLYMDLGRAMERSGFDYMMLEDASLIPDTFNGSMETYLKYGMSAPKNDPVTLVPLVGHVTSRLGIIATITTSFYHPFMAARLMSSLDHITDGRVGANLVTAHSPRGAQNYGRPALAEHDTRYRMAREWVQVADQLWNSWEDGAVLGDLETPRLVDHTKVHTIDFEGEFFSSRGPLNTIPSPQRRPVICQAGGSPAGREFAAEVADTIIAGGKSVEAMKSYRDDITERMLRFGRNPTDCKVLMTANPVLGETNEEAREKKRRQQAENDDKLDYFLAALSYTTAIDMGKFDLDAPLPDGLTTDGAQSILTDIQRIANGRTLREIAIGPKDADSALFVGTPDAVASMMGDIIDESGADGFLLGNPIDRRSVSEITDGLMPALQRRGLVRDHYEHALFRDNLLAF